MKSEDRYLQYCADIAELLLNLEEAEERVKDWTRPQTRLERRILTRIGLIGVPSTKNREEQRRCDQEVEDRKRWLRLDSAAISADSKGKTVQSKRAGVVTKTLLLFERVILDDKATTEKYEGWEVRRTQLAHQLVDSPWLLNCVLHALDRGDETYFLYLTRKVTEINEWLSEHRLWWFRETDKKLQVGSPRILEAWPWRKKEEYLAEGRRSARELLKTCAFNSGSEADDSGVESRGRLQKKIDAYFDFIRKKEFSEKIKSWKAAEVTKHADRQEARDEPEASSGSESRSLEEVVRGIFEAKSKDRPVSSQAQESSGGPVAIETEVTDPSQVETEAQEAQTFEDNAVKELARLLFGSPKEQSKLALLLGFPPSR